MTQAGLESVAEQVGDGWWASCQARTRYQCHPQAFDDAEVCGQEWGVGRAPATQRVPGGFEEHGREQGQVSEPKIGKRGKFSRRLGNVRSAEESVHHLGLLVQGVQQSCGPT